MVESKMEVADALASDSAKLEPQQLTKAEIRQLELIKKLQEKNKAKQLELEKAEKKRLILNKKVRELSLGSTSNITSRLFESKKKMISSKHFGREEDQEQKKEKMVMAEIIQKAQQQGPDPRHAAFLAKLSERKKLEEREKEEKELEEKKRKQALSQTVRAIGKKLHERRLKLREAEQKVDDDDDDQDDDDQDKDVAEEKQGGGNNSYNKNNNNNSKKRNNKESKNNGDGEDEGEEDSSLIPSVWTKHKMAMRNDFEQERGLDRPRWAQKHGISEDTPVFICSNGYPAVRAELKRRGWYENQDKESDIWDLHFTMKITPIVKKRLKEEQIVNRFFGTGEMCSKSGLAKNLKSAAWVDAVDPNSFFPRCYMLAETNELEDFLEDFKLTAAERILKLFKHQHEQCGGAPIVTPFVIQTAIRVCLKFINRYNDDYVDAPSKFVPPVVSSLDWSILKFAQAPTFEIPESFATRFRHFAESSNADKIYELCLESIKEELVPKNSSEMDEKYEKELRKYISYQSKTMIKADKQGLLKPQRIEQKIVNKALETLESLKTYRMEQGSLNGDPGENVWIAKPAGKSRGRGIECFKDLDKILQYTRVNSQESSLFVVQKYMENSLIIHKRKFDIRQWVLVSNWNPLTIYFYDDCYLRFCVSEYSLNELEDRFVHLANNSISKHSENFHKGPIDENMMRRDDFIEYLDSTGKDGKKIWYEQIKPKLQSIAKVAISCVQDLVQGRPNSFEIYGIDFMIDDELNPWLIEINSSPSMEYSTKITKVLAKEALTKVVSCILDGKYKTTKDGRRKLRSKPNRNADTGAWELLHVGPHEQRRNVEASTELSLNGVQIQTKRRRKKRTTKSNNNDSNDRSSSNKSSSQETKEDEEEDIEDDDEQNSSPENNEDDDDDDDYDDIDDEEKQ